MLLSGSICSAQRPGRDGNMAALKLRESELFFIEGEKFFILEDYAKALDNFQKAIDLNPENAAAHFKMAQVFFQGGKRDDLIKASLSINQAIKLQDSNEHFHLLAASIYTGLGRFDQAVGVYRNLLEKIPGSQKYLFDLAAVYEFDGQIDKAIQTYTRAEEVFGVNEVSSGQKQKLLLSQGKINEAIAEGEKLVNAFPGEYQYVASFADLLSRSGRKQDAIAFLERAIKEQPDLWSAQMLLAGMYKESGQEEKASILITDIFKNPSADLESKLLMMGVLNTEIAEGLERNAVDGEKSEFALSLLTVLQSEYPDNPTVNVLAGDLYLSLNRKEDAAAAYLNALESGATGFDIWRNLISLEIDLRQFAPARKHVETALEYYPTQGILYYLNGLVLYRQRNYTEAIFPLEECKRLSFSNNTLLSDVNALIGDSYNALKQYDKSDQAYEAALKANPENYQVLNNYSYYLALRKAKLELADKMSAQLVEKYPDDANFMDTRAWVLYAQGKFAEARKILEKALSGGKVSATHFEHYGDILYKLGEIDNAVLQWKKARELNGSENLEKKIANRRLYE